MSRIVLLIENVENRRLLAEALSTQHEVHTPSSPLSLGADFDLGIVDRPSLERWSRWIDEVRRTASPLFLPILLVTQRHGSAAASSVWQHVDELIVTPVERPELGARVQTLLRARSLSLANAALARRLETELARAREVQSGLLPQEAPSLRGFDLAARCVPAREIGGDFFDWQALDGAAVLSVGDVMGKGIPAALLAATVRAVLRALAHRNPPGEALDLLAQTLASDLERTASFVTLFHARVEAGQVCYVDAGHGHAIVRRASGALERLERGGRPIGFPSACCYHEARLMLGAGDLLVVFSDGLVEGGASGTSSRTAEELTAGLDVSSSARSLVDQLVERAPKQDCADDVTVLVLKKVA